MLKEKVFYMDFQKDGSVKLYDGPTQCAHMENVQWAKQRARELTPDGYKTRLLNRNGR